MTTPHNDAGHPLSRREAREQAERAATPANGSPLPPAQPVPAAEPLPATPQVPATQRPGVAPVGGDVPGPVRRQNPQIDESLRAEAAALFPRRSDVGEIASRQDRTQQPAPEQQLHDLFDSHASEGHKRRGGCLIPLIVLLVILGGLGTATAWAWNTYGTQIQAFFGKEEPKDFADNQAKGEVHFTVADGDSGLIISEKLFKAGVTKTSSAFYDYVRKNEPSLTFYPGTFPLQEQMSSKAVAAVLGDPNRKVAKGLLIREGETLATILPALAEGTKIPLADLQAAVANPSAYGVSDATLEGWLFPATYDFAEGTSATDVIKQMVELTIKTLDAAGVPPERRHEILTIASIIQREAGQGDMAKVSRVIQNRLGPNNTETHGLLQMDSTVAYGVGKLHSGVVATTDADRANDNPYNTYKHAGLPAGPIANSGKAAIVAAMNPAEGPWFYFVTINLKTGETRFATTYAEQLANEKLWHDWCKANPDSGCYG